MRKEKARHVRNVLFWAVLLLTAILLPVRAAMGRTTYVITDGSRVMVHTSSATDPETVLDEAGLRLGENDSYTAHREEDGHRIHVRRGQLVSIDYYGHPLQTSSGGETVAQLLERLELTWEEADTILPSPETQIYDGMEILVARTVCQNQTYTTTLPYKTILCADASLPEGTRQVITAGESGQLLCQAAVTYLNGAEAERKLLSQQVVQPPVNEVVAVGTGQAEAEKELPPAIGSDTITLPGGEVVTYAEKFTCLATAYTCEGYVGTTATGTRARVGAIAVDPEVFPYGTRFYIETQDGEYLYGIATAEDCGSKEFIYGTRLDLYFNTRKECVQFGARSCDVYVLG